MKEPIYLGDSVYAKLTDTGEILLYTYNGITSHNQIFMDKDMIKKLYKWSNTEPKETEK